MKIAVITAACGKNAKIIDPPIKYANIDYIAFVYKEIKNIKCWDQRIAQNFSLDDKYRDRRNAKIYKIIPQMFLPEYDYWIWIDSTHSLIMNPKRIIGEYLNNAEIGLWKHRFRDCVYSEALVLKKEKLDHIHLIDNQIEFYKAQNYPKNNGLYELNAFIRKNTQSIRNFNNTWWEHICKFSSRDQLSMPFVLNKYKIKPETFKGNTHDINGNMFIIRRRIDVNRYRRSIK